MPLLGVIAAYAFTEDVCARTVQKLDRGVDGRSWITLLTDSRSSTIAIYEAAGARGTTVVVPSTKAATATRYLLDKH